MRRPSFRALLACAALMAVTAVCTAVIVVWLMNKSGDVSAPPASRTPTDDAVQVVDTTVERPNTTEQPSVRQSRGTETVATDHSPDNDKEAKPQQPNETQRTREAPAPSPIAATQRGEHYALLIAVRDYGKASGLPHS